MIRIIYVFKRNRDTELYNVGINWFNKYKIVWNRWFLNKRICVIKMDKL
ncbi:MAG: hypothetical protein KBG30_13925 [Bacteroidales bacterium]|nr:hypothetical protein [Bacteroidales bacterium]